MRLKSNINILCFGDSNTWGFVPGSYNPETDSANRFSFDQRWPGRVQILSNNFFHMYEEGLSGRTINTDDPEKNARNGLANIQMLLDTHEPLDLVIVFLGANDCKKRLSQSIGDLCRNFELLLDVIENSVSGTDFNSPPKIMVTSYPLPSHEHGFENAFVGATEKLRSFNIYLNKLALKRSHLFFDAAKHIRSSEIDGIHFDLNAHRIFSDHLLSHLKDIYNC